MALAECEAPQIKKTLRACLIDPRLILEAKTKQDLIDLAEQNGIFSTLDEWTIEIMRAAKEAGKSPLDAMLQATRETRGASKKAAHKSPMAAAQAEPPVPTEPPHATAAAAAAKKALDAAALAKHTEDWFDSAA